MQLKHGGHLGSVHGSLYMFLRGAHVFHLRGARSDNTFWLFKNTLEPKTRTLRVVAAHLQRITAIP